MPNSSKKLYHADKIIPGLIIFLAIVMFPFWYNMGKAATPPDPKLTDQAKAAKECIYPKAYMQAEHMQLLNVWRTQVVRNGERVYSRDGKQYNMSLSNTCLDCHSNKAEFCDQCHTYASVTPYCWDCHIDNPKETK